MKRKCSSWHRQQRTEDADGGAGIIQQDEDERIPEELAGVHLQHKIDSLLSMKLNIPRAPEGCHRECLRPGLTKIMSNGDDRLPKDYGTRLARACATCAK
jgi:hypothetical protein